MTQGAGSLSGGNVSLQSQEVNLTAVNQRLVVAPPGYSKKTSGLLVRVINALMDIIRNGCLRYRAGLFFNPGEVDQALGQFDAVAHENDGSKRLEDLEKLEALLQGLSDKGVHYILGEFIKQILDDATEFADWEKSNFNVGVEVFLFEGLCEKFVLNKSSHRCDIPNELINKCIVGRLKGEERLNIYDIFERCDSAFMRGLVKGFRQHFMEYAYWLGEKEKDSYKITAHDNRLFFSNILARRPYNVEQAFYLLGNIAKYALVDGNNSFKREQVDMEHIVSAFDWLFRVFCGKGYFSDGYSPKQCARWVLDYLEDGDRDVAIGVLKTHNSILIKSL